MQRLIKKIKWIISSSLLDPPGSPSLQIHSSGKHCLSLQKFGLNLNNDHKGLKDVF